MWNPMRRTDAIGELVDIIHRGAAALAHEAGAARRGRRARARRRRAAALGVRARVVALQRRLDHHVPDRAAAWRSLRWSDWFLVRPLLRQVTDEQVALISRSTSRRSRRRSSARSRCEPNGASTASRRTRPRWFERLVRVGGREVPGDRQTAARVERRAGAPLRRRRIAAIAVVTLAVFSLGPGLPAPCAVGAADRLAQRRGGRAVPHRSDARQRHGAARRRSDDHREARRASTPSRPR